MSDKKIIIRKATENNLKSVDIEIPTNKLVVITGVSGSGKSSLAFDIICKEGQRRYLESFSSYARIFLGKLARPQLESISGISPAISVSQQTVIRNPRSTVGTMTEIYDYLRLLFARLGETDSITELSRNMFSFNSEKGACPNCKGLGVEDKIDPELLVDDSDKSIRERCLTITTPNGYIMYSQVTLDVLNEVCESEGFSVDIPWKELTEEQKNIIYYGSEKITVPYGKHTLESRLTWTGITAKPREEGYYKGILPVMENILIRDRNPGILRFARTQACSVCDGKRLNERALEVLFRGKNIYDYSMLSIDMLHKLFEEMLFDESKEEAGAVIRDEIIKRTTVLKKLGLGYLTNARKSTSLSGGEAQRIRLAAQVTTGLQGVLYVFDEPSIGLHPQDNKNLIEILRQLVNQGNTVLLVEHDEECIRNADHIIDIGPMAGDRGGEIIFNGSYDDFIKNSVPSSLTHSFLVDNDSIAIPENRRESKGILAVKGANRNNLKEIDISFKQGVLNVITGVSGAGKSSLVEYMIEKSLAQNEDGFENIDRLIHIDQTPIGKTPRSNPATYTKVFDLIRDLYASLPKSKEKGWKKGRFSFNNKGGRCEYCQGAGYYQAGMHFMGTVDIVCPKCSGKRFNEETLSVLYKGKSICDILEMRIEEALVFFEDLPKIYKPISVMNELGLGYIQLGQPSTTISGGESQRVKLSTELQKQQGRNTLYVLDEPTTGLHFYDVKILLVSLQKLIEQGNTVIVIEHDANIIKVADHIVDLGPGSGADGGELVASGSPEDIMDSDKSITGNFLKIAIEGKIEKTQSSTGLEQKKDAIVLKGVNTNNLKNIDVSLPHNAISVITGVSGSGKSSLAFDTIFDEGQKRFSDSLPTYAARFVKKQGKADFDECYGLSPAIAINRKAISKNPRSTVGTISEVYDLYRLLYARAGVVKQGEDIEMPMMASLFSFNHESGACGRCKGLGFIRKCDPEKLISHPEISILDGAMKGSKPGRFFGDKDAQWIAILKTIGQERNIDYSAPYSELDEEAKEIVLYGAGDIEYDVIWTYKRKNRTGTHEMKSSWKGFLYYIDEEYEKKHADKRADSIEPVMKDVVCSDCEGARINSQALSVTFGENTIAELSKLSINESIVFFEKINYKNIPHIEDLCVEILNRLYQIKKSGLGNLSLARQSASLSGGESQRLRLASLLGGKLTGITYVLDEPTVGLHQRDTKQLIEVLKELKSLGNTIVIVEHDADIIKEADYIIDIGPEAGEHGGKIIAEGTLSQIKSNSNSITGKYLASDKLKVEKSLRKSENGIDIKGASANNLKNINVAISKNVITAITGVSGSGKSSLLFDVIAKSAEEAKTVNCSEINGINNFNKIVCINQSPIGANVLSTPATYSGVFDLIRAVYADTKEAKEKNIKKNYFSFNNKGGRCDECSGIGYKKISMDFLADIWVLCEECSGKRYRPEALSIKIEGKSIADVLKMSIDEAKVFFSDNQSLHKAFGVLADFGLGYLKLGQTTNTLSGGESQRLKLATEIIKNKGDNNLYLLDEPSTGLHYKDIERLLIVFDKMIQDGHSLVFVEHNPFMIDYADNVVELGPEGGDKGGELVS